MAMYIVKPWYRKKDDAIYGAEWAGGSDPSWVRTDAAVGFSAPNPYYAGMSSTPSSPFDNIMPWAGMRRVTDANAGELVEIPKFYYKLSQPNGVGLKIQISMSQFDGSYVDPMHMDRGDGVGERDYTYVGRYHCSSSNYKSASGVKPKASITRATARTNIHNLGSNVWQWDFATRFTLCLLYLVEFADWDSQTRIGYGCGEGQYAGTSNMGYTDTMPYHTGKTKTSRLSYGSGTQYRYVEGLWDEVYDMLDGGFYSSSGMNVILNPINFSDNSGGVLINGLVAVQQPASFMLKNVAGTYPIFLPASEADGNYNSYDPDAWYWSGGNSYPVINSGGCFYHALMYGMMCFYCQGTNTSNNYVGTRLMVLPPSRLSA